MFLRSPPRWWSCYGLVALSVKLLLVLREIPVGSRLKRLRLRVIAVHLLGFPAVGIIE